MSQLRELEENIERNYSIDENIDRKANKDSFQASPKTCHIGKDTVAE